MASGLKLRVLLVDDNAAIRESFAMLLASCDYEVRTAHSGLAGLSLMRENPPDVVISDLNMPQMSGYEFLSLVRQFFPEVLSVAMSGAHQGPTVPPGVAAHAFFGKGENILSLLEIVANLTANSATCLSPLARAA